MKINKKKLGFTLVELLVVIAILAVLATVAIIGYSSFINEAHKSNDNSVVTELNHYLKAANPLDEKVPTATDAAEKLEGCGLNIAQLQPSTKDAYYGYNYETKEFVFVEGPLQVSDANIKTFLFAKNQTQVNAIYAAHYSVYLQEGYENNDFNAVYGLDVGKATVSNVTYTNVAGTEDKADGIEVVIRTNSANTTLTIDDTSEGTIYHYGSAGALNIIQCHTASYHENGKVAFAEIGKGRIVLENGSQINHIHVNKKENAQEFDTVIIQDKGAKELPSAITRDQVDVSEAKAVVTVVSGSDSETVYVYPYTDAQNTKTGSTEKTATQNSSIVSDLGQLVLDNGSDAGEKAMSNNDKEESKAEIVETAQNEEEIEEAKDAGLEITHYEALEPTCIVAGYTAYDSYYLNNEEVKVGYKVIEALGHDVDPETGICNRCDAQVYVFKVGNALYKSNQFSAAWSAAKNSSNSFKILCDLTLNVIQADGRFTLDLNGKTLTLRGHASLSGAVRVYGLTDYGGDLTIQNGTLELPGTNNINYGIYSEGNLTVENVTINSACKTTVYVDGLLWNSVGSANLTNVVINATHASGTAYNAHSVSAYGTIYSPVSNLTNVTITSANDAVMINATNANLQSCNITASGRAAWIIFSATGNTIGTMTIDGETTLNAGSVYNRLNAQDGNTIVIEAGIYNFDPTNYVNTEAFDIAENAGVYTVSSK